MPFFQLGPNGRLSYDPYPNWGHRRAGAGEADVGDEKMFIYASGLKWPDRDHDEESTDEVRVMGSVESIPQI